MSLTQDLYTHAKERIPGGTGLLSKSPEQFAPGQWPGYYTKAKGCEVWDLDGNHYYDFTSNGIGACLLGFADPDVSMAAIQRITNGSMCTQNPPEEVWLADRLCEIHPWADCVRYARTGGETCAIAVRIARATTRRDIVAICGYHGWTDWYLAANLASDHSLDGQLLPGLAPLGVPSFLTGSCITFNYENYEEFDNVIRTYGDRLACVIMEPTRHELPDGKFLRYVKEKVHKAGGLLIFDEITIGWRYTFGGIHKALGITPDIAVFGKATANGHPIGAVIGTKEAMDGANDSFISSTFWTEALAPAAALAAIDKMERTKVWEHALYVGETVQNDWKKGAEDAGIAFECIGIPCLAHYNFKEDCGKDGNLALKTLYTVLMLKEGFLTKDAFYPTLAHTEPILALHREASAKVFAEIGDLLRKGGIEEVKRAIGGPVCYSGFKRLLK